MALSPHIISQAIFAAAPNLGKGLLWKKTCESLGAGIYKEIINPKTVILTGSTNGVAGAGTIPTGKIVFAPIPDMQAHLASNNIKGVVAIQVATACIVGVTNALNSFCEYYGTSAGVGIGGDISKVTMANPEFLTQSIQSCLLPFGLGGIVARKVARGVGYGISSILLSGVGSAGVIGSPSPVPASGVSTCFLR